MRPNLVLGVPRVYEKVRDAAYRKAADGSAIGAKVFRQAEKTAVAYSQALEEKQAGGAGPFLPRCRHAGV